MKILHLTLRRFRNLAALDWAPAPGLNLIHGDNGQGKTNLLEGLHLALSGRSFRTRNDRELRPWPVPGAPAPSPADPTRAEVELARPRGERRLRVLLDARGKRAYADGRLLPTLTHLLAEAAVVTFTPEAAGLLKGAPSERRRWLDVTLAQRDAGYLGALQRYARALRQLQATLHAAPQGATAGARACAAAFLPGLAANGALLMRERARQLAQGAPACAARWQALGGAGTLELLYQPSLGGARRGTADEVLALGEAELAARLEGAWRARLDELFRRGACTFGPHRDDFTLAREGHDLRAYGSQGQHRLAALTLQLEAVAWLEAALREPPVVLLDDFGSELDPARRARVLAQLAAGGLQVFITATAPADLGAAAADMQRVQISEGQLA